MLVTTLESKSLNRFGRFYYKRNRQDQEIQSNDGLFLFKGYLYPDVKETVKDLFSFLMTQGLSKDIKRFKGRYCGCLVNKANNSVTVFTDQLGLYDIFFYFESGNLIIGDKFSDFFNIRSFSRDDLDIVAMAEFLVCEHVLGDRTFLKNVQLLPLASIKCFHIDSHTTESLTFWEYLLKTQAHFNKKEALQTVDMLLKQSMQRIHALNPGKTFTIGLSGGYDSRLAARYALDAGVSLNAFVYNHLESDAYFISEKLAQQMEIPLKVLEIKESYLSLKDTHIHYNPMHNIMYTTYGAVRDDLPQADVMLSGFLGGELFGNHIRPWDTDPRLSVVEKIKQRVIRFSREPIISKSIEAAITNDLSKYAQIQAEDWQRCEVFEYENRQRRFIKDSPTFNFYGYHEQYYSIFADIDLVEYVTTFPYSELVEKNFYVDFLKHFLPELAAIRGERQAYTLYDGPLVKKLKSKALTLKMRLYKSYGVKLPIFKTIDYTGQFDWHKLLQFSGFYENFRDIELADIDSHIIRDSVHSSPMLKFLYLTLQSFMETFIDGKVQVDQD